MGRGIRVEAEPEHSSGQSGKLVRGTCRRIESKRRALRPRAWPRGSRVHAVPNDGQEQEMSMEVL